MGIPKIKGRFSVEQNQKKTFAIDEVEQNPNIWEKLKEMNRQYTWSFWSWCHWGLPLLDTKALFLLRPYNPPRREREFPQKVVYTRGILPKMAEQFRLMIYTKLPYNTLE